MAKSGMYKLCVLALSHPAPRKGFAAKPFHSVRPRQQSLASQSCLILVKMNAISVLSRTSGVYHFLLSAILNL
jgi:hypothetical protein